ncbi:MAG: hypothetical protein E4G74_02840 [Erysipelotrichales bacterium]|nr:MAG: hypothetical protein E4G74_02840 [Erysipelotrichales bacterium]
MSMESLSDQQQLSLTIALKLGQLQREGLKQLNFQQVEETLLKWKWKKHRPITLSEAVNDVLSISGEEVVAFLSRQAIIEGQKLTISEFEDIIGG